jgi:hypothetical protein
MGPYAPRRGKCPAPGPVLYSADSAKSCSNCGSTKNCLAALEAVGRLQVGILVDLLIQIPPSSQESTDSPGSVIVNSEQPI